MDPSRNNMPLQFNKNKNKPPLTVTRISGEDDAPSSTTHNMLSGGDCDQRGGNGSGGGNMMGVVNVGNMMGQMVGPLGGNPNMMMLNHMFGNMQANQIQGPMMGGPGMMNPVPQNLMGPPQGMMGGGGPQGMMEPNAQGMVPPTREVITLKSCVLYPPPTGVPPRTTRAKPPGCRTIFVGGLPENITEEILAEVFENCGPVNRIRISKKKFSHIRFENMESVNEALFISGYRMKINDLDVAEDTGRIHVDYAEARDDQYEFECLQRALAREMRHLQRVEEERNRPTSPQPVVRYSDHEAVSLLEKMKSDDNFLPSSQLLINWLERGECNRRTVHTFYALVQNVHGNLRRVSNEIQNLAVELEQFKIQHQQRLQAMIGHVCQVERVLASAHKQRNWDHFTKAQRKNILTWQRQAQEMRESHEPSSTTEDNVGINDDMDLSDDDDDDDDNSEPVASTSSNGKKRKSSGGVFPELTDATDTENQNLKEENDHLKCQMEAFKNEVDIVRHEGRAEAEEKDKQIKSLQNALQGMQQQLIAQRASVSTLTQVKEDLEKKMKGLEESNLSLNTPESGVLTDRLTTMLFNSNKEEVAVTSSGLSISDKEAKMIGLVSCFLHVHPNGATVDYLWSYLSQIMTVRVREVEDLLEKMPSIFEQKIVGVGATIERKWTFTALSEQKKL